MYGGALKFFFFEFCFETVMSSEYARMCVSGGSGLDKSWNNKLISVGEHTAPCGTPLLLIFVSKTYRCILCFFLCLYVWKFSNCFFKCASTLVLKILSISRAHGTVLNSLMPLIRISSNVCVGLGVLGGSKTYGVCVVRSTVVQHWNLNIFWDRARGIWGPICSRSRFSRTSNVVQGFKAGLAGDLIDFKKCMTFADFRCLAMTFNITKWLKIFVSALMVMGLDAL